MPPREPPPDAIDIGHGHMIAFVTYEDEVCAINDWHRMADGATWCVGFVDFKGSKWAVQFGPETGWTVVKREPLTLEPSILCRICRSHGFIRDGRWVPA